MGFNHAVFTQVREVLGDFDLRGIEDVLKVADAERPLCKEMQDAQPRLVAEAFVNFDQLHDRSIYRAEDIRQQEYRMGIERFLRGYATRVPPRPGKASVILCKMIRASASSTPAANRKVLKP